MAVLSNETKKIKYDNNFCGKHRIKNQTSYHLEVQPIENGEVIIEDSNYHHLYIHDLQYVRTKNVKTKLLVVNNVYDLDEQDIEYDDIYAINNSVFNSTQGTIMFNGTIFSLKNHLKYVPDSNEVIPCLGHADYEQLRKMLFEQIQKTL